MATKRTGTWVTVALIVGIALGIGGTVGMRAFVDMMRHSKPPSAVHHLTALAEAADAYLASHPSVPACGPYPATVPSFDQPVPWPAPPECFATIGFEPLGYAGASLWLVPVPEGSYLAFAVFPSPSGTFNAVLPRGGPLVIITHTVPISFDTTTSFSAMIAKD